jgi:hypothetical protein
MANTSITTIKTIADFGFAAGRSDAGIAQYAAKYHALYVAASEDTQDAMRRDYCHNYLVGKYSYTHAQVAIIAETKRTERSEEDQRAWNNAQSNFNYRVVNDCGHVVKAAHKPAKQVRVAKDLQTTIAGLVAQFGKDAVREAMKRVG